MKTTELRKEAFTLRKQARKELDVLANKNNLDPLVQKAIANFDRYSAAARKLEVKADKLVALSRAGKGTRGT